MAGGYVAFYAAQTVDTAPEMPLPPGEPRSQVHGLFTYALLKALADPKRFELLERIAKASCPLGCMEARSALAISPATLSHHIKELETAGLITIRREGKFHFMSLRTGVLNALIATLSSLNSPQCKPADSSSR